MYDSKLSLEIDWCHWQLDALYYRRGWRAALARHYWMWRLRRAERRLP